MLNKVNSITLSHIYAQEDNLITYKLTVLFEISVNAL